MFLTAIFWVSGADASALVLAMLSSYGKTEPNKWLVALWALMSAILAAVLLLVGGLGALQTFDILVASPFVLVMIGLCWALYAEPAPGSPAATPRGAGARLRAEPRRVRLGVDAIMAARAAQNGGDGSGEGQQPPTDQEEEEARQRA